MKKYLLFGGSWHYPKCGIRDLVGDFDDINEAKNKDNQKHIYNDNSFSYFDWGQIVDIENLEVISCFQRPNWGSVGGKDVERECIVWQDVKWDEYKELKSEEVEKIRFKVCSERDK